MAAASKRAHVGMTRLGNSGLQISRIILGMMSYGTKEMKWVVGQEECTQHVKTAFEAGINTFDTADMYSQGLSEVMLGNAIKELKLNREDIVILTKCFQPTKDNQAGGPRPPSTDEELDRQGFVNQRGLSRKHIFSAVQASLKRLQVDYIDVLQCHRFDYNTPIEETMRALHDVVQMGWVRYVGMSSCYAWQFWRMQTYAIEHNLTPFISMQNFHNASYREEEREMVPTLKHFGVGMIPWSPIARGFLARPLSEMKNTTRGGGSDAAFNRFNAVELESSKEINRRVEKVAKETGHSMAQVAYAWSMAQPFVDAPIVGSTKLSHLEEAIEAAQIKLTEEQLKFISEPYQPQAIRGHA